MAHKQPFTIIRNAFSRCWAVLRSTLHLISKLRATVSAASIIYMLKQNPDNDQPEQYHFNNIGITNFKVIGDNVNPLLDVTFDGLHILDGDLVSAKPDIEIMLKDETSLFLLTILRNSKSICLPRRLAPQCSLRTIRTHSSTQLIPRHLAKNNTARVELKEEFYSMENISSMFRAMIAVAIHRVTMRMKFHSRWSINRWSPTYLTIRILSLHQHVLYSHLQVMKTPQQMQDHHLHHIR